MYDESGTSGSDPDLRKRLVMISRYPKNEAPPYDSVEPFSSDFACSIRHRPELLTFKNDLAFTFDKNSLHK